MPRDGGRASIVIIHGSGDYDMDGSVPDSMTADGKPGRLYKQLADALTEAGFVVLRYHKRGVLGWDEREQASVVDAEVFGGLEVEDLVADAAAAVRFLRTLPGEAGRKVLLVGHSEGTALAPLAAARERVDGLVLMGAMARRLDAVRHDSVVEKRLEWARDALDQDRDGLLGMEELVPQRADPFTKGVFFDLFDRFPWIDADGDSRVSMAELRAEFERTLENDDWADTPWYLSHLRMEPNSATLPSFRGPILIMQGERDSQTPLSEARLLDEAIRASGHPDHTILTFPGLGHAFSPEKDCWKPTLGPMDGKALQALADWARRCY
ncbi:MAG: alpha/beta fold hydrolase [Elusimicrobia bacterium]|nr:alpha/beta fold hydrolase [Elusimicrobiota bacterium]